MVSSDSVSQENGDDASRTTLPLGLTLGEKDRERFSSLFQEPVEIEIAKKAIIYLHILHADTGDFDLQSIYDSVVDASVTYALSRRAAQEFFDDFRASNFSRVREKFRFPELTSGEGGEVLLYSFLECHLNAPKLLSKLELKTAGNDYVKAADGVHFRRVTEHDVEIIFGESKMHSDSKKQPGDSIRTAIYDAFKSMAELRDTYFNTDRWLVESNLLKEAYDQNTVDALSDLLIPNPHRNTLARNSFGVFLGYELDTTAWPTLDMDVQEIQQRINEEARALVNDRIEYVRDLINEHGLGAHHFHFYMMPFLKQVRKDGNFGVPQVRKTMAERLSGKESK